jgi:serine acetyltransferase/GT2 family glycosyltransferase
LKISVVIATYNRLHLLLDLLADLGQQTLPPSTFEVIVVDDGSRVPVAPRLAELTTPYPLMVHTRENGGPAAARHHGVEAATGDILVFVDDDMSIGRDFLEQHLAAHLRGSTLVQGTILPPAETSQTLPLFERFHAEQLERFVRDVGAGRQRLRGIHVCTGNVSVRRADYLAQGGFDRKLARSEDRELGVRLEKAGGKLELAPLARSVHRSDHDSLAGWLARSFEYGVYDLRIARKHPDVPVADPWRFVFLVNPVSRPMVLGAFLAPSAGEALARLAFGVASRIDRGRGRRLAVAGATLAYGLEYFAGLRTEYGSVGSGLAGLAEYVLGKHGRDEPAHGALGRFVQAVRGDFAALQRTRAKYNADIIPFHHLPIDVARKIGFQMMVATRAMRLLRDGVHPLAAQVASRLIRHLYGAEIHWDAELEPGIVVIHGIGLVLSHSARVAEGCILFHNVTLGEGTDPETRQVGAPSLGANVHVGPGATIIGPVAVGEGTKIMAGTVLTRSVPNQSLVKPADVAVQQRAAGGGEGRVVRRLKGAEALS